MGNGGCGDTADNDVVELEAMRSGTFSWHPCQVHLCSIRQGLIVQYGDDGTEEMIEDKDKVPERIRVRSTPLQVDECSSVQQGDRVLASKISHLNRIFCDAKVKQAIRVRHSKRAHCRCSFIIKWLDQSLDREETVPSSAIMKLSNKSINLHPTISAFLTESSSGLNSSPFPIIFDSIDMEKDIDLLLDKQIEEISNSTFISGKKNAQHILFGLEVDPEEQVHGMVIDVSLKDHTACPSDKVKLYIRHEVEQPMETTMENFSTVSSVQDKFSESISPLNPLAARAALALIRSNFSPSEPSVQSDMEVGNIASEYSASKFLYSSGYCSFPTVSSITDDTSSNMAATFGSKYPNYEGVVKTLFPTSNASDVPSIAQAKAMKNIGRKSENQITVPSEKRLTRAQVQRNTRMAEATQFINSEETQLCYAKRRKVTCKTDNDDKIEVKEAKCAAEENAPTNFHKSDSSVQNKISSEKPVASPVDCQLTSADGEKIPMEKDCMVGDLDSKKVSVAADIVEVNNSKRLTRAVARRMTEMSDAEYKLKLENVFEGNVASESSMFESDKPIFSPTSTKTRSKSTKKRENAEGCIILKKTPTEHAGGSIRINRNIAGSTKQETRFSPRLRFLSQTRSQNKG